MDREIQIKITENLCNHSVKFILKNELETSSSLIKKLKQTPNGITVNGTEVNVKTIVNVDDIVVFRFKDDISQNTIPVKMELEILYEDEDVVVLNKPRSMPTHISHNHYDDTLANGLMHYYMGQKFTFRAITRLDRDTSGVVIVAKNPFSAQKLSNSMKNKEISKEYIAVVNGVPNPENGVIEKPIKRINESIIKRCVANDGKEALTEYETIETTGKLSLVKLKPLTGRTHQLRVHMSYIGCPIYGDDLYNAPQTDEKTRLHCQSVSFAHPFTNKYITVSAPAPGDITNLFK